MKNENYNKLYIDKEYEELVSKRTKSKSKKIQKFVLIVLSIITLFIVCFLGLVALYINSMMTAEEDRNFLQKIINNSGNQVVDILDIKNAKPRITALVLGVDADETRTDVMFIATINKKTSKIDLITLPRDTQIIVGSEVVKQLRKDGSYIPSDGTIKLNELHAYALRSKPVDVLKEYIEGMLGIKIDYYVKVNLSAFRKIVDAVGGIEFDVPQNMYYYDPNGIFINLKKGSQLLNGKQAEQLVRFRSYPQGDFQRMQVQQAFLKEAYKQVIGGLTIDKLPSVILTLYQYVQTDFSLADIPEAIKVVKKVDPANVESHVVTGTTFSEMRGGESVSFVRLDMKMVKELVGSIFSVEDKKGSAAIDTKKEESTIKKDESEDTIKWEEY